MEEWIHSAQDCESRNVQGVRTLLGVDVVNSWPMIESLLEENSALMVQAFLTDRADYYPVQDLPSEALTKLFLWLSREFPRHEDPQFDDAHFVGPREVVGQVLDRIISILEMRGSKDAVDGLKIIADARPQELWLHRVISEAETRLHEFSRRPLDCRQLGLFSPVGKSMFDTIASGI